MLTNTGASQIDDLTREELSCVLAHELSHIKNGDIRLMAAANAFLGNLSLLPFWQQTNAHFAKPDLTIMIEACFVALAFVLIA